VGDNVRISFLMEDELGTPVHTFPEITIGYGLEYNKNILSMFSAHHKFRYYDEINKQWVPHNGEVLGAK